MAACKAPDGSYWALQQFKRLLPNLGVDPWLPRHRARELQLSHWTGELPKLDVYADWVMSFRYHELFGRLTYRGKAVFGYKSSLSGEPLDTYGRLIFLDTYNSRLGAGWKRENSFLARRKGSPGHFCYMFVQRNRYGGYPAGPPGPPANGERYRLTSRGPGVTPVIMTVVDGLQDYDVDPDADRIEAAMNPLEDGRRRRRLRLLHQLTGPTGPANEEGPACAGPSSKRFRVSGRATSSLPCRPASRPWPAASRAPRPRRPRW